MNSVNPGNLFNSLGPKAEGVMSSVIALVTGLVKSVPNEEFGVLARWMNEEGNRRRDHVRTQLQVGTAVVWVNTTGKLTHGVVIAVGAKNSRVRSQHGGELFIPLSRLELESSAAARLSSLPTPSFSSSPTGIRPLIKTSVPAPVAPAPALTSEQPIKSKPRCKKMGTNCVTIDGTAGHA